MHVLRANQLTSPHTTHTTLLWKQTFVFPRAQKLKPNHQGDNIQRSIWKIDYEGSASGDGVTGFLEEAREPLRYAVSVEQDIVSAEGLTMGVSGTNNRSPVYNLPECYSSQSQIKMQAHSTWLYVDVNYSWSVCVCVLR